VAAQTCSFAQVPIQFGAVSLISGAGVDVTGRLSVNCSGIAARRVYVCSHLGAGTGGVLTGTGQRRYLTGANGRLDFNLYKNSAYTSIWGSSFWGLPPTPSAISLTLGANGTATASLPVYGRILLSQSGAAAGTYSSSFAGADAWATYAYDATSCAQVGSARAVAVPLQVTGTVLSACRVSATPINFGTASLLQNGVDAQGTISVTCSRGTPFAIKLGGGAAAATDPRSRQLRQSSGALVTYGIYQDAARTIPWGNQESNDLNVASATGLTQTFPAYGRVPAQRATPGSYADTVLVEVTY
jgi:spore coat protein U-like protein